MSNVVSLGAERIKRITPGEWKNAIELAIKERPRLELELKQKLIDSGIVSINEPSRGKYLFMGIFMEEGCEPIYIWADSSEEAMIYGAEYDLWMCEQVIDENGNIAEW